MATSLGAAASLGLFQMVLLHFYTMRYDRVEAFSVMFVVYAALIGASVAVRRGPRRGATILVLRGGGLAPPPARAGGGHAGLSHRRHPG